MKKILCIVVALFMVFGLAACDSSTDTATETASEVATESASEVATESATEEASAEVEFPEMTLTYSIAVAETTLAGKGILKFKELVEDATDGKVKIDVYFSSSMYPQDQELEAMMKGNLDFNSGWFGWQTSYMPELSMFDMAYLFKDLDHFHSFFESDDAQDLFEEIAGEIGVRYLAVYGTALRTINLDVDKKVTCREDLNDIKLRVPNTESFMFAGEALGANPTPLGFSDLYLALQTGTVDGQDNPVATIKDSSFYEVTESVTITGHMISSAAIIVREDLWQSMTTELQQVIQQAATQACAYMEDTAQAEYEETVTFLEEKGMKVYELTDEELSAYSQEVIAYYFDHPESMEDWDMDLYQKIQDMAE